MPMFSVRLFAALACSASTLLAVPCVTVTRGATNVGFKPPAPAFVRPLGGPIPQRPGCTVQEYALYSVTPQCNGPNNGFADPDGNTGVAGHLARPGLGLEMGGIGAGNFMINQAGTFGPWFFGDQQNPEERILPQAAFHLRVKSRGQAAVTRTLAVNTSQFGSLPAAWHGLSAGQGDYSALYPFGWMRYRGLPSRVRMRFWSPLVARNDYWSSLPVAFFDMRVANPTNHRQRIALMFSLPNAPAHVGAGYEGPASVRTGFSTSFHRDRRTGVRGLSLSASSPANTPDAADSDWTMAVRPARGQKVTYASSWNGAGDGRDLYHAFSRGGRLPNKDLDASRSAGAIAVTLDVPAHQARTVPFVMSWDFPKVSFGSPVNTIWMRRYTDFFGARENAHNEYLAGSYPAHQGFRIADAALSRERRALAAVSKWWAPIARDRRVPAWLRTAALNEVGNLPWNGSFWEGGLVSTNAAPTNGGPRIGAQIPGTHLFFNLEGGGYSDANCWDCDIYGHQMLQELFPNLARDLLRGWTQMTLETSSGAAPHDAGNPDPWIEWGDRPQAGGIGLYIDEAPKYIARAYEYFHATGDKAFLAYAYPAMQRAFTFEQSFNHLGDHLPIVSPQGVTVDSYDGFPREGHEVYNSELELLAEAAMIEATKAALSAHLPGASQSQLQQLQTEFAAARAEFETTFWDPTHRYFRIDSGAEPYSDGVMADQLLSQQLAQDLDLPDLVDPAHIAPALKSAFPLLTQFKDAGGHGLGAANAVDALGHAIPLPEACLSWTGVSWLLAATMYGEGTRFHDPELKREALELGRGIYHQIYENLPNGFAFDVPEGWGETSTNAYNAAGYLRPRSVWELLDAVRAG